MLGDRGYVPADQGISPGQAYHDSNAAAFPRDVPGDHGISSSGHVNPTIWRGHRHPGDDGTMPAERAQLRPDEYGDGAAEHDPRHPDDRDAPAGDHSDHAGDTGYTPADPDPAVGRTGARFGPYSARLRKREKPPELATTPDLLEIPPIPKPPPIAEPLALESEVLIRPYARTGGRTRPTHDLALEALVSTSSHAQAAFHGSWEHRTIANLCAHPHSVAEVAALLTIPLGVARILLADMAAAGTVVIHGSTTANPPDLILMNRVLAGLRRL